MKITDKDEIKRNVCRIVATGSDLVEMVETRDGLPILIFKRGGSSCISNNAKRRYGFSKVDYSKPMTHSAYVRSRGKKFRELLRLDLINENCLFATFTIAHDRDNDYDRLCDRFKHTTNQIRNMVGGHYLGRVRSFELQENGRLHIHAVLVFDSCETKITKKDFEKFWGLGSVHLCAVTDKIGLADYLTNMKVSVRDKSDPTYTIFRKGARVIDISPTLPRLKSEIISADDLQLFELYECAERVHVKAHKFGDNRSRVSNLIIVADPLKRGSSED